MPANRKRPTGRGKEKKILHNLTNWIHGAGGGPRYAEASADFTAARQGIHSAKSPEEKAIAIEHAKRAMERWKSVAELHSPLKREVIEIGGARAQEIVGKYREAEIRARQKHRAEPSGEAGDLVVPLEESSVRIKLSGKRLFSDEMNDAGRENADVIEETAERIAKKHDLSQRMAMRGKGEPAARREFREWLVNQLFENLSLTKDEKRELRAIIINYEVIESERFTRQQTLFMLTSLLSKGQYLRAQ